MDIDEIYLTPDEKEQVITKEKNRRAALLGCNPDEIRVSTSVAEVLLKHAVDEKKATIIDKEYWKKVNQPREYKSFTSEQLYNDFIHRATAIVKRDFVIDDHNREIIRKLCNYFTASPECESLGLSLRKGIMLIGGPGTGKTTIMKAFSGNQFQSYKVVGCRVITYDYAQHGFEVVKNFGRIETVPLNRYGQGETGICFDDLGTDDERKHYGDAVNPIKEILLNRYDNIPFHFTHVTSNLNPQMVEDHYGIRLRSRIREMFNVLKFDIKSPDRRK